MKYFMIILFQVIFDLTSGHPLSSLENKDEPLQPDLTSFTKYFRSVMASPTRTFGMNLTNDHGYVWNDVSSQPISYDVGNNADGEDEPIDKDVNDPSDIFVGMDKEKKLLTKKDTDTDLPNSIKTLQNKKNIAPIFIDQAIKDDKTPETLKELLNNEQFWKWLSEWVGAYMEMLAGHLSKIVKEEVAKQVQFYFNIFESEMAKKSMESSNLEPKEQKQNKIVIDDKELPLTHTSNLDLRSEITKQVQNEIELLRRRNDKEDKKHKNDEKYKPIRVEAQTVYGNSLGNEKVVNVYVFYPKDLNSVLEDIKPITDGVVNGTFSFGPQESITINVSEADPNGNDKGEVSPENNDKDGANVNVDEPAIALEGEKVPEESEEVISSI